MDLVIIKNSNCLKIFNNQFLKNKVILALNYKDCYFLKKTFPNVIEPQDIIPENNFKIAHKRNDKKIKKILVFFNKTLFKSDKFFKKKKWNIFNNYYLDIKLKLDFLIYLNLVLNKIFSKYRIQSIHYRKANIQYQDDFCNKYFSSIDYILNNNDNYKLMKKYDYLNSSISEKKIFKNSILIFLKNLTKEIFFLFCPTFKSRILFVNFGKHYLLKKFFNPQFVLFSIVIKKKIRLNILDNLGKSLFLFNDLNLKNVIISFYNSRINEILILKKRFYIYNLKIKRYKFLFFKYSGYPDLLSILLMQICKDLKISYIVWSHGAWGFAKSLGGYLYTDLFLSKNIGYVGEKPLFNIYSNNFYNFGYLNYNNSNNLKARPKLVKKTILLIAGYGIQNNEVYFGYNRKNCFNSLWRDHLMLINILKNFTDRYDIIFKDYSFSDRSFSFIIKDICQNKIKYVSSEFSLLDLMKRSDLNIFTYLSTSFLDSLKFKSDIIALEPDLRDDFDNILIKNFGVSVFKNFNLMKKEIINKLEKNDFKYIDKNELKEKYFFNFSKIKNFEKFFTNG